jgi:hypothetical protein
LDILPAFGELGIDPVGPRASGGSSAPCRRSTAALPDLLIQRPFDEVPAIVALPKSISAGGA